MLTRMHARLSFVGTRCWTSMKTALSLLCVESSVRRSLTLWQHRIHGKHTTSLMQCVLLSTRDSRRVIAMHGPKAREEMRWKIPSVPCRRPLAVVSALNRLDFQSRTTTSSTRSDTSSTLLHVWLGRLAQECTIHSSLRRSTLYLVSLLFDCK